MKNIYSSVKTLLLVCSIFLAVQSCKKNTMEYKPLSQASANPAPDAIAPAAASGNSVLTLTGNGLGDLVKIVFSNGNIPATINPTFNTESAIVFRVPDTANGGDQNIIFTNSIGKEFSVSFRVIALPLVTSASAIDYQAGDQITLTGNNLEDVTSVTFEPGGETVSVISRSKKQLVVQMPASTVSTTKLKITNTSGSAITTQEFTNVDEAYGIFKDDLGAGIDNWSWSLNISPTATDKITGSSSMKAEYTGSWGGMQLHWGAPVQLAGYRYVTFWIKGAAVDKQMKFNFNWTNDQTLTIPANVWTYYKIDLNVFRNAGVTQLETWVMQIHNDPEILLLDNVILVK
jgi:hypothetical protein